MQTVSQLNTQENASGRVAQRRERMRRSLIEAAEKLSAERGLESVSIDDIVALADVAKGTFYNHFADKEELGQVIASETRARMEEEIGSLNRDIKDPAMRMARAVTITLRFALAYRHKVPTMMRLIASSTDLRHPLNIGLLNDIRLGRSTGRFVTPSDASSVAFVVGVAMAIMSQMHHTRSTAEICTFMREMGQMLLSGLGMDQTEASAIAAQAVSDIFGGT